MKSPWRDGFFFSFVEVDGLMERMYIYMDEIDLLQVFLFKRNETFGKEKF